MNKELTTAAGTSTIKYLAKAGVEATLTIAGGAGWIDDNQGRPLVKFERGEFGHFVARPAGPAYDGIAAMADIADVPALAKLAKMSLACYGE